MMPDIGAYSARSLKAAAVVTANSQPGHSIVRATETLFEPRFGDASMEALDLPANTLAESICDGCLP
jgi:hypothetical protein